MFIQTLRASVAAGAVAVSALALASPVSASPVALVYDGPASGFKAARVESAPVSVPGNVLAGGFNMRNASGLMNDFVAWCLDMTHYIGARGRAEDYTITSSPFSNSYAADGAFERVQTFFDANYDSGLEQTAANSAAFQLGLWEVLYDDDFDIGGDVARSDDFSVSSSANVEALASGYLSAAQTYSGSTRWDLTFFESLGVGGKQRQNLVTAMPSGDGQSPSPVPLPAAGLLLIGGLGGLAAMKRRRKAAS